MLAGLQPWVANGRLFARTGVSPKQVPRVTKCDHLPAHIPGIYFGSCGSDIPVRPVLFSAVWDLFRTVWVGHSCPTCLKFE